MTVSPGTGSYDGILLAVSHWDFIDQGLATIQSFGRDQHVLYDLKSVFRPDGTAIRL